MNYRALGSTGLVVSELGYGCWGIGGISEGATSYGETDDVVSRDALRRAYDRGITLFDTADVYGSGRSEEILGEALKQVRPQVVLASKVGMVRYGDPADFSPAHIMQAIEGTLRRLQTTWLDLYQLHSPDMALLLEQPESMLALRRLKEQGKIRAFGISVREPQDAVAAIEQLGCECVQVNFNLIDQRPLQNGLLQLCERQRIALIARTPLCFGFLSGRYSAESVFDERDHRSRWPREQIALWASAHNRFRAVVETRSPQTSAQLALRYCISYPEVSTTIPGMLTPQEVEENAVVSDLGPLAASERLAIEGIYRRSNFFVASS